jgi:hypothetical protein
MKEQKMQNKSNERFTDVPLFVAVKEQEMQDKPNNTIPLFPTNINSEYQKALEQTIDTLENIKEDIKSLIFPLAVADKWKEWSDEQEIGEIFNVTEDMLENTGDKNIELLWEIIYKINDVIGQLLRKCGDKPIEKEMM